MNNYTYPVLQEENSAYKDNIKFKIINTKYEFNATDMNISLECCLTSEYFYKLITDGDAYILVTVTTLMNKIVEKIYEYNTQFEIKVPLETLAERDNVSIQCYILARKEFYLKYNSEMCNVYRRFKGKTLMPNTYMAISNKVVLYYKMAENSFIDLSKAKELEGKGIKIDIQNSDSILFKAGNSFCDSFAQLSNQSIVAKELLNCIIAFLTIYHTTVSIKSNPSMLEEIKDKAWYEAYEYIFKKSGVSIEEFFENDSEGMDMLIERVQELLENVLENTIVKCRELLKKEHRGDTNE